MLPAEGSAASDCSPLPPAGSPIVRLAPSQAAELPDVAGRAKPGTTIELADGVYRVPRTIVLTAEGVSLRSRSGRAARVTIDGRYETGDLIAVAASNVTVAELTLKRS
jgi:hypothetical protein